MWPVSSMVACSGDNRTSARVCWLIGWTSATLTANDSWRNARAAFDAQVVQRVLWRLRESDDGELRRDLAEYLDRTALASGQQAVA